MDSKIVGCVLGAAGLVLWFMPLANVNVMDMTLTQSASHVGGIAYLLLAAVAAYTVLSWLQLHVPRMIAAGVALGIVMLFFAQAGRSAAWGMYAFVVVLSASLYVAYRDNQRGAPAM